MGGLMNRQIRCTLILFTTAAIWGFAYVAQKLALGSVGPLTLNTLRGGIAFLFLIPCHRFLKWFDRKKGKASKEYNNRTTITAGIRSGIFLCLASVLQAYGIAGSEVGKAGFLTTLYIVLVPIFSIFIGKKCGAKVWLSVVLAMIGTYFLCVKTGFQIERSDLLLILCAVFFALDIVSIGTICDQVDSVKMSIIQFMVSSACTLLPAIFLEHSSHIQIWNALPAILYSGVLSCGVGYTIEIIGQDGLNPTVASLILSFESVFSLLAGWLFLKEYMSIKELTGCLIVVAAVILAQLPERDHAKAAG